MGDAEQNLRGTVSGGQPELGSQDFPGHRTKSKEVVKLVSTARHSQDTACSRSSSVMPLETLGAPESGGGAVWGEQGESQGADRIPGLWDLEHGPLTYGI